MLESYIVQDAVDECYWQIFSGATVRQLQAMSILDHIKTEVQNNVRVHYYRKAK